MKKRRMAVSFREARVADEAKRWRVTPGLHCGKHERRDPHATHAIEAAKRLLSDVAADDAPVSSLSSKGGSP
jgi:hypothetical protein